MIQERKEFIERRIASLEARLERLDKFGEDDFEDGTVLWFQKRFSGRRLYTYAALKIAGTGWYLSGTLNLQRCSWEELVTFMEDGVEEVWVAVNWERVV